MQAGDAQLHTRVLLVDDQPADLAALERYLAPFSLDLVTAGSGEEALERFRGTDFALVLMDVRLPGLDGFETARLLKEHGAVRHVPLIFLTGTMGEEVAANGYESGGVDWLRKPVDPNVLRAKVRVFVEMHREREQLWRQQAALREREREVLESRSLKAEAEREQLVVELREAVRLRDEFLSVASHELKTPLTPLALRLQLLHQKLGRNEPSEVERLRTHVEAAQGQLRRLTALVDSLLDVTRISGGRLTLRREEGVNLAAVVREVLSGFEAQAARASCPLDLEAPARVVGQWDVLRLEQVVTNLLSNALKFGAGGTIHLRVEQEGAWARLSVRDEGIGMSEDVLARLFGRFERGVSERHYGGLGLGLFITQQVVRALGGHIHVRSAPGLGSTFTVDLPCSAAEEDDGGLRNEA